MLLFCNSFIYNMASRHYVTFTWYIMQFIPFLTSCQHWCLWHLSCIQHQKWIAAVSEKLTVVLNRNYVLDWLIALWGGLDWFTKVLEFSDLFLQLSESLLEFCDLFLHLHDLNESLSCKLLLLRYLLWFGMACMNQQWGLVQNPLSL